MPENKEALTALKPEWLDQGYSTALEGDLLIDLLFVASSKSFSDLRPHVLSVMLNGVPVITLDVDGLLLTKKTSRETDIPDRMKLRRLRQAIRDGEQVEQAIAANTECGMTLKVVEK